MPDGPTPSALQLTLYHNSSVSICMMIVHPRLAYAGLVASALDNSQQQLMIELRRHQRVRVHSSALPNYQQHQEAMDVAGIWRKSTNGKSMSRQAEEQGSK